MGPIGSVWFPMEPPESVFDLRVPYAAEVTVDPELPEPLYQQVAAILRERIASGELAARIPSLKTIAETYGVSHVTAEKAMNLLATRG